MSSDRDRWQELDEEATPGSWYVDQSWPDELRHSPDFLVANGFNSEGTSVDFRFIAAARTAWPAAERECAQLRRLLQALGDLASDPTDNPYMRLHQIAGFVYDSGLYNEERKNDEQ